MLFCYNYCIDNLLEWGDIMIELPEARTISKQLRETVLGKKIISVGGNYTDHKFTFYIGDPNEYNQLLSNRFITDIIDRNFYIEIEIEDYKLTMRDGANIRYYDNISLAPTKSKLLIVFEDESCLNVTTSMYSAISVFDKKIGIDNEYYLLELNRIGALDNEFTLKYFRSLIHDKTLLLSTKAFLATEQRILGIGNGVVQDILWNARLHPKRKMMTLDDEEIDNLYASVVNTLEKMVSQNGRNTEKDIFGNFGNYQTVLSSKSYKNGCPNCSCHIVKEQYLGGSIYYCPECQK